ncbi:cytochrome P450 family protein [Nocardiopsis sp. LOL_012]|uniref:cytochrome P450 family protein n=1 Tax=Nocardiopsis sp. LOL_012 TaxID=3345409 RepID=UPI003A86FB21
MSCPMHAADGVPLVHAVPEDVQADRERLYQEGPVTRIELPGGVRAWATTHHEVSKAALNDPRFAKSVDHWADYQNGRVDEGWPLLGTIPRDNTNMLALDGPAHRRMRQLTSSPFSARRVERLRPDIERVTAAALDALEPRAGEVLDLRKEFTFRVPMSVIGLLYGVEESEYSQLGEMYGKLFSGTGEEGEHLQIYAQLFQFFSEMVARKRAQPGDDFTTDLLQAGEEGDGLSDEEVVITLLTVVAAGHETTVNLLNNAVRALLAHPAQFDLLKKGEISWDAVIEEVLRYDPPNNVFMFRFATEDVELGGHTIRKGEALATHYGAASRDRTEFGEEPHPSVFDPSRTRGRHITFGYGPHICPGAPLSRLEARIVLPMLFERFPDLELAVPDEELRVESALSVTSLAEFPVRLRP